MGHLGGQTFSAWRSQGCGIGPACSCAQSRIRDFCHTTTQSAGVVPQTVPGRHGWCSCASQTSSGSNARTRSWPSVRGSSSSPNHTATSPPTTTGRPPVSTTTTCVAACVARRRDKSEPGKQLELAVDRDVSNAGRLDPLGNGVVVLAARVLELPTLDVDRPAGEEVIAAAVIGVQVCVDDHVDAGEIEVLVA